MNDYLKNAREYIAYADAQEDSHAAQMALAAAAIAQAEAVQWQAQTALRQAMTIETLVTIVGAMAKGGVAERQAAALERIDRQLARIATVLNELTSPKLEAPDWDEDDDREVT